MKATLHLAPPGADKAKTMLALLRGAAGSRDSLPRIWALTATKRQEQRFQDRLIGEAGADAVFFNVEFFNFYTLNRQILRRAREPARRLSKIARFRLLRQMTREMLEAGELAYFARIAETPGFASVMAEFIDELKQSRVEVKAFAAAARDSKDRDIAAIYRRYQDRLRNNDLVDLEGEGWLALATLRRQPLLVNDVDLALVDGYEQFTRVQAQALAALAAGARELHITLTEAAASPSSADSTQSRLARNLLIEAFISQNLNLEITRIQDDGGDRAQDLRQLGRALFADSPIGERSDALRLIAMPDPEQEVKAVLRAVKRHLLGGAAPDDMLIALRNWTRYAGYFETGGQEFEIPLALQHPPVYSATPLIAALIDLLHLAPRFRRRDLLDVLRSPYFEAGLKPEAIDLLDRLSLERQFPGGAKADWLEFLSLARPTQRDDDDAERLEVQLAAFFDGATPPERATNRDYVNWLKGLLGSDPAAPAHVDLVPGARAYSLEIRRRVMDAEHDNSAIANRDRKALASLEGILRELDSSADILGAAGAELTLEWERFRSDLTHALESEGDSPTSPSRAGKALVIQASAARGLPHQHVYIVGLSESIFPAELPEDPLYLDSERESLAARGIPLRTGSERSDDQGIFRELVSLAQTTLTLSRPTFRAGKAWMESPFWRAALRVFPRTPIHSRRLGATIAPEEAANPGELMLAVADRLNTGELFAGETALRARNWLRQDLRFADDWRRVERGRRVEQSRLSTAPFDAYSGILTRPALIAAAADGLTPESGFSASRLKDYGLCGFRYFAKRLLQLEESPELEAGADVLQIGSLNHAILEETYDKIQQRGLSVDEGNLAAALEILSEAAAELLADAPGDYGFRETAAWQDEARLLLKRLRALIQADFSEDSPLNRFGGSRRVVQLEHYFENVEIALPDGAAPIRVTGFIDRIDRVDDGLVVVDYKTGSAAISRREMEIGRDFQMMLYVLALTKQLQERSPGDAVAGGLFWHLRNRRASGLFRADDEDDIAAMEMAGRHIARNLAMGRAGQFPVHATELENGKCARYCEFSRLCRMNVASRRKTLPAAPGA